MGQGRLDTVLQASPEERRHFIEEAAGVLKHRKRKEKALRKLEAMAGNLARVTDLTGEIRRQLGPLARQAEVARRAQVVQIDLRDAKARLLADDLVQLTATLAQEQADETALRTRRAEVETAQEHARHRLTELESAAAKAAPALSEASDTFYRLSSLRERLRGTASLAAERCRLLGSRTAEPESGRDPDDLDAQAKRARGEEADLALEAEKAQADLQAAVTERQHREAAAAEAEKSLAAVHRGVADRREGLARITGQVAARRSRLEGTEAELTRLRADLESATERARTAQEAFSALEQQVVGSQEGEEGLDAAHEEALQAQERADAEVVQLVEAERAADGDRATWTARRDALELSLARKDATGALLESTDLPGITATLADHVRVEPGYETALAAALGTHADAALADAVEDAVDALRYVRAQEAGQARLVIASDDEHDGDAGEPPSGGVWAVGLVSGAPSVTGTLARLLRGVVVVEDLAAARAAVAAADVVAVTRDGDVLSRTEVRGGSSGGPSVLELHAAHDEAETELAKAVARAEQARFALGPAREAQAAAREEVDRTLSALHASDAELAAVAERLGQLGAATRAANAEIQRITPAIETSERERERYATELAELVERLEIAQREPAEAEADLEGAAAAREETAAAATQARQIETDARLVLRTVEERVRHIRGRAESLERAANAERHARQVAQERARRRAEQAEVADRVRSGAERALAAIDSALALAHRHRERAEAERTARDTEIAEVRTLLDGLGKEHAELTDVVHKDEVARAQQQLRIEQLQQRAVEELGTDPEVLVEEFGPHQLVPAVPQPGEDPDAPLPEPRPYVREEQEKRLRSAERALNQLGRVNPLALEEHAALEERHRFLTEQLADLKKSRADLEEIIREIDERVEVVFSEAYADTAREFEGVFSRLFPGGEGRLLLTNPQDMLTTGIEVEARPPGKKVKRLSLLSGGERSLTAVALLVAIFKARPSPFYVMDEVEAALDDVNLGRLLDIFRELQEDSQLIVVTHQKRTMEIGDALYGVTMRGDGVTTVISQRLHEAV
ncbi:chromosome segregation protein SMC [Pseudactinotalea suaedae]